MALAAIGVLLQAGAQLFAVAVVVSTVAMAPPRSLAMYTGEYGYDSGSFWAIVPTVNFVLLLVALRANWRTPRRRWVISAVGAFVLAGLFAGFVTGPYRSEEMNCPLVNQRLQGNASVDDRTVGLSITGRLTAHAQTALAPGIL